MTFLTLKQVLIIFLIIWLLKLKLFLLLLNINNLNIYFYLLKNFNSINTTLLNYHLIKFFNFFFKFNFLYFKNFNFVENYNFFNIRKFFSLNNYNFFLFFFIYYFKQVTNSINLFYYCIFNNKFCYFFFNKFIYDCFIFYYLFYDIIILKKYNKFFEINFKFLKLLNYNNKFKNILNKLQVSFFIVFDVYNSFFFLNFLKKLNLPIIALTPLTISFSFFDYPINTFKNDNLIKLFFYFLLYDIYFLALLNKQKMFFQNFYRNYNKIYLLSK